MFWTENGEGNWRESPQGKREKKFPLYLSHMFSAIGNKEEAEGEEIGFLLQTNIKQTEI